VAVLLGIVAGAMLASLLGVMHFDKVRRRARITNSTKSAMPKPSSWP